jgi:hypothetical protein
MSEFPNDEKTRRLLINNADQIDQYEIRRTQTTPYGIEFNVYKFATDLGRPSWVLLNTQTRIFSLQEAKNLAMWNHKNAFHFIPAKGILIEVL